MVGTHSHIYDFGAKGVVDSIFAIAQNFGKTLGDGDRFVAYVQTDSRFYFLCSKSVDLKRYAKATGFYIIDTAEYNDEYVIGSGLYSVLSFEGLIRHNVGEEEAKQAEDMLKFFFLRRHPFTFWPEKSSFSGSFEVYLDEDRISQCYYLYDYMPQSRGKKPTDTEKRVSHLVYAFKDGKAPGLAAKLVSLAVRRVPKILDGDNLTLAVVPASNADKHEKRYAAFAKDLARRLRIREDYGVLYPAVERPERKKGIVPSGFHSILLNGTYTEREEIEGRNFLLFDDIYTTGRTYRAAVQLLFDNGAKSITGLFLAKTVLPETKEDEE